MNKYDFETDTIIYKDHTIKKFFESFPQQQNIKDYVRNNLICLYVGGSHAYGLNTEESDVDIRGIFKDSIDMILGLDKVEQLANESQDFVIYSLTKLLPLVASANPNCMEALWVDEEEILYATYDYWYIRSYRNQLLSKVVKHKYSGYAISQLKRIKGHDKWLVKEKEGRFEKKPNIKDYIIFVDNIHGLIYKKIEFSDKFYFMKVKDEIYNVFKTSLNKILPLIEEGNSFIPIQENRICDSLDTYQGIIWFNKSQFQTDLDEYNNYIRWKENRNETRHELEEKYGYDSKHAMHTFRLLLMGVEILEGKGVLVKRPDRDFLLDIRRGKFPLEDIISEAEKLDKEDLEQLYHTTTLPKSIDKELMVKIVKRVLNLD